VRFTAVVCDAVCFLENEREKGSAQEVSHSASQYGGIA
jgi:hypothetical protein